MKIDFEGARLYVRPGSTDLRKGVTGLLAIIENEMHLDALSNSVFFFCNKSHKLLKIIFWNKTGFWLAQKRLEMATWPWPNTSQEARASCFILSLIETAKQNSIAPEDYLRCLFEKAPYAETENDWEKLLPWNIEITPYKIRGEWI